MEGFGWFTFEIVKRIVKSNPNHDFYFFFDRPYDQKFLFAENVIPIVLYPPARHPILFKIWFNHSVTRAIKRHNIDLFFSPDGYLSLKTNVPQIGVIHDLNFEHYPEDIPKSPRLYLRKYFRLFAKKATHIITVSEYSKSDIISEYNIDPNKITVAHNAASHHFSVLEDELKQKVKARFTNGIDYFVYVGAIHPRKNVNRLLSAFSQFKSETKSPTKLLIVGENLWSSESVENKTVGHKDVIFTGHVGIETLAEVVGSAKALCLVSYFEGFGIPLVEAMQCGVPLLSGNLTALPEVCGDAGVLVDPFSEDSIAYGLTRLDEESELRKDLIIKGLIRAKTFNWDKSANIIWQEIEKCLP